MNNKECKVFKLTNKDILDIIEHVAGYDLKQELNGNCKFEIFRFEKTKEVSVDIETKVLAITFALKDDNYTSQVTKGLFDELGQRDILIRNSQQIYLEKLNQIIEEKNNNKQEETIIDL